MSRICMRVTKHSARVGSATARKQCLAEFAMCERSVTAHGNASVRSVCAISERTQRLLGHRSPTTVVSEGAGRSVAKLRLG